MSNSASSDKIEKKKAKKNSKRGNTKQNDEGVAYRNANNKRRKKVEAK